MQEFPRIDLSQQLKPQLLLVLKDNANAYWQALKRFIQAKLTKGELEYFVRQLLGEKHVRLHNQFILALFRNAHCPVPPQLPVSRGHRHGRGMAEKTYRSKRRKNGIDISQKGKRSRMPGASQAALLRPKTRQTGVRFNRSLPTLSEHDKPFLQRPHLLALRHKMLRVAADVEVTEVSTRSVELMMDSVEVHLKNVLSKCTPRIRNGPEHPATVPLPYLPQQQVEGVSHLCQAQVVVPPVTAVTVLDMMAAAEVSPSAFGENLSVAKERVTVARRL